MREAHSTEWDSSSSPRGLVARDQVWEVDAPVLERPGRRPMACEWLRLSLPPQGGNIVVRGIEPRDIEGADVYPGGVVVTPRLRLRGVLEDGELALIEPPSPAPVPDRGRSRRVFPIACDDPGDGEFSQDQRDAAIRYANAQSDLGEVWLSQDQQILNVSFAAEVARHRNAIRRVYPGPLCVVEASISSLDLLAARERAENDPYLVAHRLRVVSAGPGPPLDHPQPTGSPSGGVAHITLTVATSKQLQYLNDRHSPRVIFCSWLQPVDPSPPR